MKMHFVKPALAGLTLLASTTAFAGDVTTQTITFHSQALDKQTTYIAAMSSPMRDDQPYPVVYLLHGAYGSYRDWSEKTTVTELLKDRHMIVIMPDGGEFGWYLDSPLKPENQYETFITRDLRNDVEARFPVIKDKSGRAIAGLSMGGHGAMSLAAKHPDLYISVSSMSGILDIAAHPGKWQLNDLLGTMPAALSEWQKHSVVYLADRFTTANVALKFDTGLADSTGAVADNKNLKRELDRLGVPHVYNEYEGKHDWEYWGGHVGEHLDFHEEQFHKAMENDPGE